MRDTNSRATDPITLQPTYCYRPAPLSPLQNQLDYREYPWEHSSEMVSDRFMLRRGLNEVLPCNRSSPGAGLPELDQTIPF